MGRRGLVWMLSVPLMVAGSEAAHVVAYRIIYPDPFERAAVLASTGHGYFAYVPLALAVGLALVVCAFFGRASEARAGLVLQAQVSPRAFAMLPPATFALQEHLERLLHGGAMPFTAALEPTFLLGLALQLPFALALYLVARLLLRAAEKLGRLLRGAAPRRRVPPPAQRRRTPLILPRLAPLAAGSSGRGPPRLDLEARPRPRVPHVVPA